MAFANPLPIATLQPVPMPRKPSTFLSQARTLALTVYSELFRTRVFTVAAALAFFFLLAFVPLLLVLASLLAYLPVPNLFGELMVLLSTLVPPDAMNLVFQVMNTVLAPDKAKLISLGLLGTIWAASGGFSACIDALNVAYDVQASRPWWRDRVQAILLTLTAGGLAVISLVAILLGPEFGHVLQHFFGASLGFAHMWPLLRVLVTFLSFVVAVMVLYYLAPNIHQRAGSTFPGAVVATLFFFLGSLGLDFYVSHLTNTSKTYGALGAVVALMLWLYIMAIAILVGAEMNAELMKMTGRRLAGQRSSSPKMPTPGLAMPSSALSAMYSAQGNQSSAQDEGSEAAAEAFSPDLAAKDGLILPGQAPEPD